MTPKQFGILSNIISGLLAVGCFFFSLDSLCSGKNWKGFGVVLGVDIYLLWVLIYAGLKSDRYWKEMWWMGILIPSRTLGIFIFLLLYASVVNGFAMMFIDTEPGKYATINFSVYKSFIGLSSFSYEPFDANAAENLWRIQMWQTGNGLLLLTAAFGFLVSRLSTFKTKEEGVDEFQAKLDSLGGTIKIKKEEINILNKKIRDKKKSIEKDLVSEATDDTDENI